MSSTDDQTVWSTSASDSSAIADSLGITRYVKGLSSFIRTCATPMTIALEGGWGTGKTTLFDLVEKQLTSEEGPGRPCKVIRLNTWPLSSVGLSNALTYVLVNKIVEEISPKSDSSGGDGGSAARSSRIKLLKKSISYLGGAAVKHVTSSSSLGSTVQEGLEELLSVSKKSGDAPADPSAFASTAKAENEKYEALLNLHGQLQEAIKEHEESFGRLVIFIDDLDRLDPGDAVTFLEGIKNFMVCEGCVFVLAIDAEVVFDGVAQKYPGKLGEERKLLFFDKIIQVPFEMPVARYDIERYIQSLPRCGYPQNYRRFATIIHYLSNPKRPGGIQLTNPRTIKRYINLFNLDYILFADMGGEQASVLADEQAQDCLFALLVYRENYPEEFKMMVLRYLETNTSGGFDECLYIPDEAGGRTVDPDLKPFKNWFDTRNVPLGDGEVSFGTILGSVLQQAVLGDTVSLPECMRRWAEQDEYWEGKDVDEALGLMIRCEKPLLSGSGDRWVVTDEGARLGLRNSYTWDDNTHTRSMTYQIISSAARAGSDLERRLRSLFEG